MGTVLETLAVDLLGDGPVRSGPVRSGLRMCCCGSFSTARLQTHDDLIEYDASL